MTHSKTKRKTLGQIAYEIAMIHNPLYVAWDICCCQSQYEDMALVVAKEVMCRLKRRANASAIPMSCIKLNEIL